MNLAEIDTALEIFVDPSNGFADLIFDCRESETCYVYLADFREVDFSFSTYMEICGEVDLAPDVNGGSSSSVLTIKSSGAEACSKEAKRAA